MVEVDSIQRFMTQEQMWKRLFTYVLGFKTRLSRDKSKTLLHNSLLLVWKFTFITCLAGTKNGNVRSVFGDKEDSWMENVENIYKNDL